MKKYAAILSFYAMLFCGAALFVSLTYAQNSSVTQEGYKLRVDVNLVVLYASVVDAKGLPVTTLKKDNFRVYENGKEQDISRFLSEDVPLTVGLVVDNSASMREKRRETMEAALIFVQSSNPLDEVFVVNFNDDYFLDLGEKDFSSDLSELREALTKTRTRGQTALYDAIRASLAHSKRGTHRKKALLVISDGVDNASKSEFGVVLRSVQESEIAVYFVALPCDEEKARDCRKAKRNLSHIAEVSGGAVYFAKSLEEVRGLCERVAHDIRSQYVIGYSPENKARDGSYRSVRVELQNIQNIKNLRVRHRPGYFATNDQVPPPR